MKRLSSKRITRASVLVFCALVSLSLDLQVFGATNSMFLHKVMNMEQMARQSNTAADWNFVGNMWLNMANSDTSNSANMMARRAAACFNCAYMNAHGDAAVRDQNLKKAYELLSRLEPTNSAWPFLMGELDAAGGNYAQSEFSLKKAVGLGGTGGQKAQQLLTHTSTWIAQDRERIYKKKFIPEGMVYSNNGPEIMRLHAPGPSQGELYNRSQAASRAFNAGDMGAQSRINSGGASNLDHNRYGGGY